MIRQGMLCKHCTSKKCKDIGTDTEPIDIECPICNGDGCDQCILGRIRIQGCPNKFCQEVIEAVNLVDLFEKGLPPIQGGVLDQAVGFLETVRVLHNEESAIKAEKE